MPPHLVNPVHPVILSKTYSLIVRPPVYLKYLIPASFARLQVSYLVNAYSDEDTTQQLVLPLMPNPATPIHINQRTDERQKRPR